MRKEKVCCEVELLKKQKEKETKKKWKKTVWKEQQVLQRVECWVFVWKEEEKGNCLSFVNDCAWMGETAQLEEVEEGPV